MLIVIVQIVASSTTISQITDIFDLKFDIFANGRWTLSQESIVNEPSILRASYSHFDLNEVTTN